LHGKEERRIAEKKPAKLRYGENSEGAGFAGRRVYRGGRDTYAPKLCAQYRSYLEQTKVVTSKLLANYISIINELKKY
jgi:hypothetical protein